MHRFDIDLKLAAAGEPDFPRLLVGDAKVEEPGRGARCELSPFGMHWPGVDEDLSIAGMLKGMQALSAREPEPA